MGAVEGPRSDLICQFDNFTEAPFLQGIIASQFSYHDGCTRFAVFMFSLKENGGEKLNLVRVN